MQKDLALPGLPRAKVLATVVALLEKTMMRIGNDEYARTNKSFGLTTLRRRHAKVKRSALVLDFRAKHGIQQHIELKDRRLAGIVSRLQDLRGPGAVPVRRRGGHAARHLLARRQRVPPGGHRRGDHRQGLPHLGRDQPGRLALQEFEQFDSHAAAKKNVLRAIEKVSKLLGNTPAICRKCYIHPRIFDGYLDGSLAYALKERAEAALSPEGRSHTDLSAEEVAVVAFLSRTLDHVAERGGVPTAQAA